MLATSDIRSPQRTNALKAWRDFKATRSQELYTSRYGNRLAKGWTMKAMRERIIDLSGINLDDTIIGYVDLRGVRLDGASMRGVWMKGAEFDWASLNGIDFSVTPSGRATRLLQSDFSNADLRDAICDRADLSSVNFSNADLCEVDLTNSNLVEANLQSANTRGSRIYGVSAWNVRLCEKRDFREDLIITSSAEPEVRVDNLEVAQFIYLLLNNEKLRDVIDTITSKVVLILGRFTDERKVVLDAIRAKLRKSYYTPVMFDFSKPSSKDFIGTVKTLASMSKFIVADVTDAKVVLQELEFIVKEFPAAPVLALLLEEEKPSSVLADFMRYQNFMPIFQYSDVDHLVSSFRESVVLPAETRYREILINHQKAERVLANLAPKDDDSSSN